MVWANVLRIRILESDSSSCSRTAEICLLARGFCSAVCSTKLGVVESSTASRIEQRKETGASNDIERATQLARNMVTKWGLSEKLGPLTYSEDDGEVFLGHSVTQHKGVSDETAHTIDGEVRSIIDRNYERSEKILKDNIDKLHLMADALIKYETIDTDQIDDIMEGKVPRPPSGWDDNDDNSSSAKKDSKAKSGESSKEDDAPSGEPPAKPA